MAGKTSKITRAKTAIWWIEEYCCVPEGKDAGKPVRLRPWQKKELIKIYDNPHRTRRAIISFGRKNGKTALSAFLLLLHLCGPEAIANGQLYSAAQSRDQAAIIYKLAMQTVTMSPSLSGVVTIRDAKKELYCAELGTVYKALSSEAKTAYGFSPTFIVHDELGQVSGPRSDLYEALETATGAHENPLSIIISTQARTDADMLSVMIDDALTGADPRTVVSLYTAGDDLDPFSEEAFKAANPAYGDFMNAEEVRDMAEAARRMPSKENSFRNLILNQRVEMHSSFISKRLWQGGVMEIMDEFKGLPVYAGVDLSEVNDLTACTFVARKDEFYLTKTIFWLPSANIEGRSHEDRVPYDMWAKQGFLELIEGNSIDYMYVAAFLRAEFLRLDIKAIAFDRWNMRHFRRSLINAGFMEAEIDEYFVEFGQGYKSMSPALRETEGLILEGKLKHDNNPVMNMCAGNAVVQSDPAGNKKLNKHKSTGRIDGMLSLVMGVATAATYIEEEKPTSPWDDPDYKLGS